MYKQFSGHIIFPKMGRSGKDPYPPRRKFSLPKGGEEKCLRMSEGGGGEEKCLRMFEGGRGMWICLSEGLRL
jgi:hypothetical protein